MVMAVVGNEDSSTLLDRLVRRGFSATVTSSRGGFYHLGNTTIFCGVNDGDVEDVLGVIRESCPSRVQYVTPLPPAMEPGEMHMPSPVQKHVGGATIFVFNIDHFEKV